MQTILKDDLVLLKAGYEESKKAYEKKLNATNVKENTLFELAWDVVEYETLTKQNLSFQSDILPIISRLNNHEQLERNGAKFFTEMRKGLLPYCKGVFGKQRKAASHVFSFMIAEKQRNIKPYAIPVRFLPYSSISDQTVLDLKQQLVDEMKKLDMLSVGMYVLFYSNYIHLVKLSILINYMHNTFIHLNAILVESYYYTSIANVVI